MRSSSRLAFTATLLTLAVPAAAAAQQEDHTDPDTFTPAGYEFCGWLDFSDNRWVMEWDDDLFGAFTRTFSRGMSCSATRKNYRKLRYGKKPPYRVTRAGYRCQSLDRALEYSDVRCTKRGRSNVSFRVQSGS